MINETVKKTVEEKLIVLKQRSEDLTAKQTTLQAELTAVNEDIAQVVIETNDLNDFLAGQPEPVAE